MSRRTKREMAPPPHQTGSAPAYQIGSAPSSTIHVPTPVPALLGGGSTIPNTGGQSAEQEGAKKDVERAFGVLQARFNIVRRPARSWSTRIIRQIMKACVILHNMIVEDEGEMAKESIDLNAIPGASIVLPPEVQKASNSNPCFNDVRRRNSAIRAHSVHTQLKDDLIEHIWQRFGPRENN